MKFGFRRRQFSMKTLLSGMALMAGVLALALRFGPHLWWYTTINWKPQFQPIAVTPLAVNRAAAVEGEAMKGCRVGPFAFSVPSSLSHSLNLSRGRNGMAIRFGESNAQRWLSVNLTPIQNFRLFSDGRPSIDQHFSGLEMYRQIARAGSDDFSFDMTRSELFRHQWFMSNRTLLPDITSIETLDRPDLRANLLWLPTSSQLQWETADDEWHGTVSFMDASGESDWIRHVCLSFEVDSDSPLLMTLRNESDQQIMARVDWTGADP